MNGFWHYFGGTIVHPRSTFEQLINDPRHLALGLTAILVIGLLYTMTVAGLATVDAKISTPAWVAIPEERYYFLEIFFALPATALVWILAAGFAHLISKPFGGQGTFEQTLAVLGLRSPCQCSLRGFPRPSVLD